MDKNYKIVPSLLAFKKDDWNIFFTCFHKHGIKYIHFDVMDYEYVNNNAYDENDYETFLNDKNELKAHVHLMVCDPIKEAPKYFNRKTDAICFHFDVFKDKNDVFKCLNMIKKEYIKAGIAINPNFKFADYKDYLDDCEFVTVMGVFPGKGGQPFEHSCLSNLNAIKQYCIEKQRKIIVEIDGGMNFNTIPLIIDKGDFVVSGSFIADNLDKIDQIINWFNKLF